MLLKRQHLIYGPKGFGRCTCSVIREAVSSPRCATLRRKCFSEKKNCPLHSCLFLAPIRWADMLPRVVHLPMLALNASPSLFHKWQRPSACHNRPERCVTDKGNTLISSHISHSCNPIILPSAQTTCSRAREHYRQTMVWSVLHQLFIINRASYLVVHSRPIFTGPFSSVRANEQMLLSCWSHYDGRCCWQRHPSAERTSEGGHLDGQ